MPISRTTKPRSRRPRATKTVKKVVKVKTKSKRGVKKVIKAQTICLEGYRLNRKGECVVDRRSKIVVKSIPMPPPPPPVMKKPVPPMVMPPVRRDPYAYLTESDVAKFTKNQDHYVTKRVNINGKVVELRKAANRPAIQGPMRERPVSYGPQNRPINHWDGGYPLPSNRYDKSQAMDLLQKMARAANIAL